MVDPTVYELGYKEDFEQMVKEINNYSIEDCLTSALIELQVSIKRMLYATVKSYKERSKFSFNCGIVICTEAFQIVKRAIEKFKQLTGEFQNEMILRILHQRILNKITALLYNL